MDQRTKDRYIRNVERVVNVSLESVASNPDLAYYREIYHTAFCKFEPTNKKYIGSYCVMIPDELIFALGYHPLRLCAGHQIPALIGEEMIPRDACPVVKASAGFHSMKVLPMYNQCEVAIMPMTCEVKRKSAEVLSKMIPVVPVKIPMSKSNDAYEETVRIMKGLIKTLEFQTKTKMSRKLLRKACENINQAQRMSYLLQQKLYADNPQIKGSEVMMAINSYCYADPLEWVHETQKLLEKIREKEIEGKVPRRQKPRIFIAGSPVSFPNYKVPLMLEELGAQIVGDESCLSGRMLYDPVVPIDYSKDGMIRALAARYISACTCPVFDQTDDREASLKTRMDLSKAEGIIYHVLRGCVPYDFELAAIENFAQKEDIPMLRIETDFSTEDVEQIKIRFEAFVEMIDQRRRANGPK